MVGKVTVQTAAATRLRKKKSSEWTKFELYKNGPSGYKNRGNREKRAVAGKLSGSDWPMEPQKL